MVRRGIFRDQKEHIEVKGRKVPQQPLLEEIEQRFSAQREFEGLRSTRGIPKEEQLELAEKLKIAVPNPENTQYPKIREVIDGEEAKTDLRAAGKYMNIGAILAAPLLYLLQEMIDGNAARAIIGAGVTVVFWGTAMAFSPEETSEKIIKKLFEEASRIKVANKLLASAQITDEKALAEVEKIAKRKGIFDLREEVIRKIAKKVEVVYKAPIAGIIVTTMAAQRIQEMSDLAQGAVFLAAAAAYGIVGAILTKRDINKARRQYPKDKVRVEWIEECREEEPAYLEEDQRRKKKNEE